MRLERGLPTSLSGAPFDERAVLQNTVLSGAVGRIRILLD